MMTSSETSHLENIDSQSSTNITNIHCNNNNNNDDDDDDSSNNNNSNNNNSNNNNSSSSTMSISETYSQPPDYTKLTQKSVRLLQGPIWDRALEKMALLVDLLRGVIGADMGTVFLHDQIHDELISHIAHPEPVNIAIPSKVGIAGSAFSNGQLINSPAAYTDKRFYSGIDRQLGAPTLAIIACPIVDRENGKPIGVVEFLNKKRTNSFTEKNEHEVHLVADLIAEVVSRALIEVRLDIEKKSGRLFDHKNSRRNTSSSLSSSLSSSSSSSIEFSSTSPFSASIVSPAESSFLSSSSLDSVALLNESDDLMVSRRKRTKRHDQVPVLRFKPTVGVEVSSKNASKRK